LASEREILLVCGRYGGIDQRLIEDRGIEEVSIGDYVLSGGELGALVIIDAVGRLLPGVLGNSASPHEESFVQGLLEHPQFTRPREWKGIEVPEAILSGNHARISEWRQALGALWTAQMRPDLLKASGLSARQAQKAVTVLASLSPNDRRACGLKDETVLRERLLGLSEEGR
jgi:tRNA (guanine37-N1)-methyltransferase